MVVKEWRIDPVKLDFTSSGQGICDTSALYANGEKVINALDFIHWVGPEGMVIYHPEALVQDEVQKELMQVHICEECGHIFCHSGDMITIKKSGEYILFLPPFSDMLEHGLFETEHRPPEYIKRAGPIVWPIKEYKELITLARKLPDLGEIGDLVWFEAIRLMQWIAPGNFLGNFPADPEPDHKRIVAVSDGDLDDLILQLKTLIEKHRDSQSATRIRAAKGSEVNLTFYYDGKGLLELSPLVISGEDYLLQLEPGIVLEE